jgi:hypothetical protein
MERSRTHSMAQHTVQEENARVTATHVWRGDIVLHFCVVADPVLLRLAIESLSVFGAQVLHLMRLTLLKGLSCEL